MYQLTKKKEDSGNTTIQCISVSKNTAELDMVQVQVQLHERKKKMK